MAAAYQALQSCGLVGLDLFLPLLRSGTPHLSEQITCTVFVRYELLLTMLVGLGHISS
jgi:hypothetical protein